MRGSWTFCGGMSRAGGLGPPRRSTQNGEALEQWETGRPANPGWGVFWGLQAHVEEGILKAVHEATVYVPKHTLGMHTDICFQKGQGVLAGLAAGPVHTCPRQRLGWRIAPSALIQGISFAKDRVLCQDWLCVSLCAGRNVCALPQGLKVPSVGSRCLSPEDEGRNICTGTQVLR